MRANGVRLGRAPSAEKSNGAALAQQCRSRLRSRVSRGQGRFDRSAGGRLVALLGANGAGKSTILKAVSGLLAPERGEVTRGEITFDGVDVLALNAPDRVRRGIVHVLEGRRVLGHLTPAENLLAATSMHRDRARVNALMNEMFELFPR